MKKQQQRPDRETDHEQEAVFKRKCIAWAWDDNMVGMFLGG